ncbi:hypothetical protein P9B95_08465 [Bacillus paralicheniformis]|nr:hypothetical protein [Bacillus paralicheniformis]MEC1281313.1 hypothetical protein [Bacillus paralicheniformis]MEC1298720.1 hypothetical protein [Bacillus paralicheniformis]
MAIGFMLQIAKRCEHLPLLNQCMESQIIKKSIRTSGKIIWMRLVMYGTRRKINKPMGKRKETIEHALRI